jgi:hypothetical protein
MIGIEYEDLSKAKAFSMEEEGFLSVCRFLGVYEWIWFRRDGGRLAPSWRLI